jgi:hypothetical protein
MLISLEVIVNLIGATTSNTGLEAYAQLDQGAYPGKVQVSDTELGASTSTRPRSTLNGTTRSNPEPKPGSTA